MEDAIEIGVEEISTPELREAISPEGGDQLFRVPVDDSQVLVRLRVGERTPHVRHLL